MRTVSAISACCFLCLQKLLFDEGKDRVAMWDDDAFFGLFVIHKMMAPVYYIAVLHAVLKLGQPKWYTKETWVARFQAV